jgi:hypothetical protein
MENEPKKPVRYIRKEKGQDGRKNNGSKPGEFRGAVRLSPIDQLRDMVKKQAIAEIWVDLAKDHAIPKLLELSQSKRDDVAVKACIEIINRALGKPREFHEIMGKGGKDLPPTVIKIVRPDGA